jgi:hypothetical protein
MDPKRMGIIFVCFAGMVEGKIQKSKNNKKNMKEFTKGVK